LCVMAVCSGSIILTYVSTFSGGGVSGSLLSTEATLARGIPWVFPCSLLPHDYIICSIAVIFQLQFQVVNILNHQVISSRLVARSGQLSGENLVWDVCACFDPCLLLALASFIDVMVDVWISFNHQSTD